MTSVLHAALIVLALALAAFLASAAVAGLIDLAAHWGRYRHCRRTLGADRDRGHTWRATR